MLTTSFNSILLNFGILIPWARLIIRHGSGFEPQWSHLTRLFEEKKIGIVEWHVVISLTCESEFPCHHQSTTISVFFLILLTTSLWILSFLSTYLSLFSTFLLNHRNSENERERGVTWDHNKTHQSIMLRRIISSQLKTLTSSSSSLRSRSPAVAVSLFSLQFTAQSGTISLSTFHTVLPFYISSLFFSLFRTARTFFIQMAVVQSKRRLRM
jgi:CHASE1-domain containing sensor protein